MYLLLCITRRLVVVAAFCLAITSEFPQGYAEDSTTLNIKSPSFYRLLQEVALATGGETDIWEKVQDTTFQFDSNKDGSNFHFELLMCGPVAGSNGKRMEQSRVLLEYDGSRVAATVLGPNNLPLIFMCDDQHFILRENAEWQVYKDKKWGFVADQDHLLNGFDANATPEGVLGSLQFDLPDFLKGMVGEDKPRGEWMAVTRTLALTKSNDTEILLRFRSPSDSLRYGTILGDLSIHTASNGFFQRFCAFQTLSNSRTRLTLAKAAQLKGQPPPPPGQGSPNTVKLDNEAKRNAAQEFWEGITQFKPIDYQKTLEKAVKDQSSLTLREMMHALLAHGYQHNLIGKGETDYRDVIRHYADAAIPQFRMVPISTNRHLPVYSTFHDDPCMIWREIEAEFGPRESLAYYLNLGVSLLDSSAPTADQKIALCDALGDWGYPSFLGDGHHLTETRKNPLHDAIFRSRWQWLCTPIHMKACFEALEAAVPDSETEMVVIETLIRLDKTDQVPAEKMARWYKKHILDSSDAVRRQSLSILSLQPTGRDFLLDRLQKTTDPAPVRKHIAVNLRHRAESTLKTNRFDFITRQRCQKILSITEKITKEIAIDQSALDKKIDVSFTDRKISKLAREFNAEDPLGGTVLEYEASIRVNLIRLKKHLRGEKITNEEPLETVH